MPSPVTTMMLISPDSALVEECQEAIDAWPELSLLVMGRIREADSYLAREEIQLIVVHVVHESETRAVIHLLHRLASAERAATVIVLSERPDPDQAWSLRRLGAADYLDRPRDRGQLAALVNEWILKARAAQEEPAIAEPIERGAPPLSFEAPGKNANAMMEQVRRAAAQDTTILLGGETGTGKTRLARLIHELSPRRAEPFLVINCGALATELIESEMFGHVKGAFTGADQARAGKFAAAGRGTLLLDDIDALPVALQAKLLRAVEERVFELVGCNNPLPVQARIIAASNRRLEREVEAGRFRADLYYRLNVVSFHLQPLREQPEMIRYLATQFLRECAARSGRPIDGIVIEALNMLEAYRWPGNIRELRNIIERAVVLCCNPYIGIEDLPEPLCAAAAAAFPFGHQPQKLESLASPSTLRSARGNAEVLLILEALRKHGNNRLRAARELGISRRTLYKKLHRYGLMEASLVQSEESVADVPSCSVREG
jgi:DNA-binding NtrC family response regulator